MKRPPLPYLLLLPLLAVLLFGNCGNGVRGTLTSMGGSRRLVLRASIIRREAKRALARRQLHGRARQDAYRRIEQEANATADSLLNSWQLEKYNRRHNKLERQLLHEYKGPLD